MQYFNSITLNNTEYERKGLHALTKKKLHDNGVQGWEKAIYKFIGELINEKDYILSQSSGTTGQAKQIRLKKIDLVNSALRTQNYFKLKPSDTTLLCLPASYIAGKMMIVRAFVTGFNLKYVEPSSNPLKKINTPIDFVAFTPHQLSTCIESNNLSNVRTMIVGGAPVSEILLQKIQKLRCNVFETYGMTETCSHIAIKSLNGNDKSDFFHVLPGFSISTNSRECLIIELQDKTRIETNDIVELEENGFRWLGRYDNVINSGGIKLFPEQIEKKIEPFLKQKFIVASERHNVLGEELVFIAEWGQAEQNFDYKQLRNTLNGILSFYERPKKLYLLPEFIVTPSGKIKRKETIDLINDKKGYVF